MTHDSQPRDRQPVDLRPYVREGSAAAIADLMRQRPDLRHISTEGLADIDDLMRQLSDLIAFPVLCRKRACRATRRCQGGYGPPCLFEYPEIFATHMQDGMREIRRFWQHQRKLNAQREAPVGAGQAAPAWQGQDGPGPEEPVPKAGLAPERTWIGTGGPADDNGGRRV